jgi:hypothetical protein
MLSGEIPLLEGARRITVLRFDVGAPDDPIFYTMRGVESETDHLPIGSERAHWDDSALVEKDAEIARYVAAMREEILKSARELLDRYERPGVP